MNRTPRSASRRASRQLFANAAFAVAGFGSVQLQRLFGFLGKVHQFRGAGLHAEGHLVGVDPRRDLRVAHNPQPLPIEFADQIQRLALRPSVVAGRIGDVQDRIALAAKRHALMRPGQEPALHIAAPPLRLPPLLSTTNAGRSSASLPRP